VQQFRPAHVVEQDARLALALRAGDEQAVRELYARYGRLVHAVAHRVLADPQRAEEATQQTFLQAWRRSDTFEPGRDFAPWLATIARRTAIDIQRRELRRPAGRLDEADPGDPALVSSPPTAEQIETVWSVRAAVDALGDDERLIVRMQHLEGWTHAEIAERLDLPLGTVKSRSHRAHRRLANLLGHLADEEGSTGTSTGEPIGDRGRTGDASDP
jgi:RNA polymerase sigma factor (sigma-70 family)